MSCGVGHRCGWDLMLLWLGHRLAALTAIGPLAWKPPYAAGAALKRQKKKKKKKKKPSTKHFPQNNQHSAVEEYFLEKMNVTPFPSLFLHLTSLTS